jgi:hypothetical protein
MMEQKQHLNKEGINKIANLISKMNTKIRPKNLESPETICQKSVMD